MLGSHIGSVANRHAVRDVGLLLVGLTLAGTIGPWGWIGVVPLMTGSLGWCPAYLPFGISTCKVK